MVHFVVSLLAAGIAGVDFVSTRMADFAAVPDCGDCGGRGTGAVEGNPTLAGSNFARTEDGVKAC